MPTSNAPGSGGGGTTVGPSFSPPAEDGSGAAPTFGPSSPAGGGGSGDDPPTAAPSIPDGDGSGNLVTGVPSIPDGDGSGGNPITDVPSIPDGDGSGGNPITDIPSIPDGDGSGGLSGTIPNGDGSGGNSVTVVPSIPDGGSGSNVIITTGGGSGDSTPGLPSGTSGDGSGLISATEPSVPDGSGNAGEGSGASTITRDGSAVGSGEPTISLSTPSNAGSGSATAPAGSSGGSGTVSITISPPGSGVSSGEGSGIMSSPGGSSSSSATGSGVTVTVSSPTLGSGSGSSHASTYPGGSGSSSFVSGVGSVSLTLTGSGATQPTLSVPSGSGSGSIPTLTVGSTVIPTTMGSSHGSVTSGGSMPSSSVGSVPSISLPSGASVPSTGSFSSLGSVPSFGSTSPGGSVPSFGSVPSGGSVSVPTVGSGSPTMGSGIFSGGSGAGSDVTTPQVTSIPTTPVVSTTSVPTTSPVPTTTSTPTTAHPSTCDPACEGNSYCLQEGGVFTCVCMAGYEGTDCNNVDECATGDHDCDAVASCTDTDGAWLCTCPSGYTGDGTECLNIDECSTQTHDCWDDYATCVDTPGAYSCECTDGLYWMDGTPGYCADQDECADASHACDAAAHCENTWGSYSCSCAAGYTGDGLACSDVDECSAGYLVCEDVLMSCVNYEGSSACECDIGFALPNGTDPITLSYASADARRRLLEIDGPDPWESTDVASERPVVILLDDGRRRTGAGAGSGSGVPTFSAPTTAPTTTAVTTTPEPTTTSAPTTTPWSSLCVDVNECDLELHTCTTFGWTCDNTVGSFACVCDDGFESSDGDCVNIDECAVGTHECDPNADCLDVEGSYDCDCNYGLAGDGFICGEPCEDLLNPCVNGATCIPHDSGDQTCDCLAGFSGDTCDLDACADENDPCQNGSTCSRLDGDGSYEESYECLCLDGYGGTHCEEDACEILGECQNGAACVREPGLNAYCNCLDGFSGDNCEIDACGDPDECANEGTCIRQPDGQRTCSCLLSYTGETCGEDTCADDTCVTGYCFVNSDNTASCTPKTECPESCALGSTCDSNQCDCAESTYGAQCAEQQAQPVVVISLEMSYTAVMAADLDAFFVDLRSRLAASVGASGSDALIYSYAVEVLDAWIAVKAYIFVSDAESAAEQYNALSSDMLQLYVRETILVRYDAIASTDEDPDECALGTHECDENADCTDVWRSYECACQDGYYGDGFTCTLRGEFDVVMNVDTLVSSAAGPYGAENVLDLSVRLGISGYYWWTCPDGEDCTPDYDLVTYEWGLSAYPDTAYDFMLPYIQALNETTPGPNEEVELFFHPAELPVGAAFVIDLYICVEERTDVTETKCGYQLFEFETVSCLDSAFVGTTSATQVADGPDTISRSKKLTMGLTLVLDCANSTAPAVGYKWSAEDELGVDLTISSSTLKTITIAKKTLTAQLTYYFTVTACIGGVGVTDDCASDLYAVYVEPTALVADIRGANYRVQGNVQAITLDGTASYDPDGGSLYYAWECELVDEFVFSTPCFEDDIYGYTGGILSFTPSEALEGEVRFTLTVSSANADDSRVMTDSVVLLLEAGELPIITMGTVPSYMAPTSKLRLASTVESAYGSASVLWTQIQTDAPTLDLTSTSVVSTSVTDKSLVIKANAMPSGYTYTFRITATDLGGSSWQEVSVVVKGPPVGGEAYMYDGVTEGYAMETYFYAYTSGWSDGVSSSFTYTFSYRVVTNTEQINSTSTVGAINVVTDSYSQGQLFQLPSGNAAFDYLVKVFVTAKDSYGGVSEPVSTLLRVELSPTAQADILSFCGSIMSTSAQGSSQVGDGDALAATVTAVAQLLNDYQVESDDDLSTVFSLRESVLADLVNARTLKSGSEGGTSISQLAADATALQVITNSPDQLSSGAVNTALDVAYSLVDDANDLEGDTESDDTALPEDTGDTVSEALSNVVETINAASGTDIGRRALARRSGLRRSQEDIGARFRRDIEENTDETEEEYISRVSGSVYDTMKLMSRAMLKSNVVGEEHLCVSSALVVMSTQRAETEVDDSYSELQECGGDSEALITQTTFPNDTFAQAGGSVDISVFSAAINPYLSAAPNATMSGAITSISGVDVDGEEVEVQDLSTAITFEMPLFPFDDNETAPVCKYWDEEREVWSSEGCVGLPYPMMHSAWTVYFDSEYDFALNNSNMAWKIGLTPDCAEIPDSYDESGNLVRRFDNSAFATITCPLLALSEDNEYQCYYNEDKQRFEGPGCYYPETLECHCNHLTDFATVATPPKVHTLSAKDLTALEDVDQLILPIMILAATGFISIWSVFHLGLQNSMRRKKLVEKFQTPEAGFMQTDSGAWTWDWRFCLLKPEDGKGADGDNDDNSNFRACMLGPAPVLAQLMGIPFVRLYSALPTFVDASGLSTFKRVVNGEETGEMIPFSRITGTAITLAFLDARHVLEPEVRDEMLVKAMEYFAGCEHYGIYFGSLVEKLKVMLWNNIEEISWTTRAQVWKVVLLQLPDASFAVTPELANAIRAPIEVLPQQVQPAARASRVVGSTSGFAQKSVFESDPHLAVRTADVHRAPASGSQPQAESNFASRMIAAAKENASDLVEKATMKFQSNGEAKVFAVLDEYNSMTSDLTIVHSYPDIVRNKLTEAGRNPDGRVGRRVWPTLLAIAFLERQYETMIYGQDTSADQPILKSLFDALMFRRGQGPANSQKDLTASVLARRWVSEILKDDDLTAYLFPAKQLVRDWEHQARQNLSKLQNEPDLKIKKTTAIKGLFAEAWYLLKKKHVGMRMLTCRIYDTIDQYALVVIFVNILLGMLLLQVWFFYSHETECCEDLRVAYCLDDDVNTPCYTSCEYPSDDPNRKCNINSGEQPQDIMECGKFMDEYSDDPVLTECPAFVDPTNIQHIVWLQIITAAVIVPVRLILLFLFEFGKADRVQVNKWYMVPPPIRMAQALAPKRLKKFFPRNRVVPVYEQPDDDDETNDEGGGQLSVRGQPDLAHINTYLFDNVVQDYVAKHGKMTADKDEYCTVLQAVDVNMSGLTSKALATVRQQFALYTAALYWLIIAFVILVYSALIYRDLSENALLMLLKSFAASLMVDNLITEFRSGISKFFSSLLTGVAGNLIISDVRKFEETIHDLLFRRG